MDLKSRIILEYLTQQCGFRKLAAKYGISRTTICNWVAVHQGVHNLLPTEKQVKFTTSSMNSSTRKIKAVVEQPTGVLQAKIAALEKQLAWEKLRADALNTMIDVAEKQLRLSIRKKFGNQRSVK